MANHWKTSCILLLFLSTIISVWSSELSEEWIDPHDMNTMPRKNFKKTQVHDMRNVINTDKLESELPSESAEDTSTIYLKRVVGMILNYPTIIDNDDQHIRSGKYVLDTESESYKFLLEFTKKKKIDVQDLRKLDSVLSDVFDRKISDGLRDFVSSSTDLIYYSLVSHKSLVLVGFCICLYILYNLLKNNFSFWYIFRYSLTILLMADYAFRYQRLYEEDEKHNMRIQYSAQCDTNKMSWKDFFIFFVDQRNCERRYTTPLEVALSQVRHIIIIPMSAFGTGMGHFGNELWRSLPFPWNLMIFPLMLIFCVLLVAIMMTTINGSPFKINLFYLIHVEFGKKADNTNRLTGPAVNKILDYVAGNHRQLVQDVSSTSGANSKKSRKKIKNNKVGDETPPKKERLKKSEDGAASSKSEKTPSRLNSSKTVEENPSKTESSSSTPPGSSESIKDLKTE